MVAVLASVTLILAAPGMVRGRTHTLIGRLAVLQLAIAASVALAAPCPLVDARGNSTCSAGVCACCEHDLCYVDPPELDESDDDNGELTLTLSRFYVRSCDNETGGGSGSASNITRWLIVVVQYLVVLLLLTGLTKCVWFFCKASKENTMLGMLRLLVFLSGMLIFSALGMAAINQFGTGRLVTAASRVAEPIQSVAFDPLASCLATYAGSVAGPFTVSFHAELAYESYDTPDEDCGLVVSASAWTYNETSGDLLSRLALEQTSCTASDRGCIAELPAFALAAGQQRLLLAHMDFAECSSISAPTAWIYVFIHDPVNWVVGAIAGTLIVLLVAAAVVLGVKQVHEASDDVASGRGRFYLTRVRLIAKITGTFLYANDYLAFWQVSADVPSGIVPAVMLLVLSDAIGSLYYYYQFYRSFSITSYHDWTLRVTNAMEFESMFSDVPLAILNAVFFHAGASVTSALTLAAAVVFSATSTYGVASRHVSWNNKTAARRRSSDSF